MALVSCLSGGYNLHQFSDALGLVYCTNTVMMSISKGISKFILLMYLQDMFHCCVCVSLKKIFFSEPHLRSWLYRLANGLFYEIPRYLRDACLYLRKMEERVGPLVPLVPVFSIALDR